MNNRHTGRNAKDTLQGLSKSVNRQESTRFLARATYSPILWADRNDSAMRLRRQHVTAIETSILTFYGPPIIAVTIPIHSFGIGIAKPVAVQSDDLAIAKVNLQCADERVTTGKHEY